uniref:Peptidase A2 domain-containing protein n=1 Tax=Kalanchoe fedtschenkoi TaxID=63787 RepID=A0A7N0RGK2_KALFE
MNLIKHGKSHIKNAYMQEMEIPENLEELNKWIIPKIEVKTLYKLGTFEKFGLKQVVKTTEESVSLDNEQICIKLLSQNDLMKYSMLYKFIHIGLIQIAFKPLTLKGLPESFIACLRDARNLNYKQSLMGVIQSSLAHGPVYFNVYPNLILSLTDINIFDALTLNVKTHGYNYMPGSELICICYRIYYKPLMTLNPNCKILDKRINETVLIETNFNKSKISTRRTIKWDEIPIPYQWILEKVGHPKLEVNEEVDEIIESSECNICIKMTKGKIPETPLARSSSSHSYISPIIEVPYLETSHRASTSHTEEEFIGQIESSRKNYKPQIQDEINKLYKYNNNPTYYNRPSPVDILHEEQEYILNNSYNGKNIYEWNLDVYTEKRIYNLVHRMLMYSTISKMAGNTDSNIAKMITAGFTGQLKGWWDNYLTPRNKDEILSTVKQEDGRIIENAVYTLVINIIEHFTGRVSDNNENIRTLLQNLRCKTLTNFKLYKDAFLNRVMELPECNSSHWKSKFIDGLPHLFTERVTKTLRKDMIAIPYDTYTYGELIKTCIQEGLSLCNEIRLNQQIKRQSLLERNQLGQFCGQIGHYANKCRMKDKIKNLNLDEELKDSLKKLLINSESETESSSNTETETDSSGSTNLGNLYETTDSEDNACCSSCDKTCLKQGNGSEDEIYKLISQFKDNDSLNVLRGNDLIEFLQSIKDKELRSKIIESIDIPSSSETRQNEEISKIDNNPYMMSEVFKTLRQKQKTISETPTSVLDLKIEIDNLKDEIKLLKQLNNNLNERVSKLENKTPSDLINPNEPLEEGFLSVINMIMAFKFHIKIKLLINNSFMVELIALIDSGADVSVIQEGLIPTKYFEKTTYSLRHAGGEKLQIDFKLPKPYICNNKVCILESFLLVKNITNQVILGTPFLKQIFPITHIDDKYFEGKNILLAFPMKNPLKNRTFLQNLGPAK